MDVIANNIHHAADVTAVEKVALRHLVVRPLLLPVFMEFFRQKIPGPQPYPNEGIGIFTLMMKAWWVVVLAAAPMVNVSLKPLTLTLRDRE